MVVCSEIRTKHVMECEYHVECLNGKRGGKDSNRWALKG
jgi:hypothetical protein